MERHEIPCNDVEWGALIQHVISDQATVGLVKDHSVVARISPVHEPVLVADLNAILSSVPRLDEEIDSFAADIENVRKRIPPDKNAWDF